MGYNLWWSKWKSCWSKISGFSRGSLENLEYRTTVFFNFEAASRKSGQNCVSDKIFRMIGRGLEKIYILDFSAIHGFIAFHGTLEPNSHFWHLNSIKTKTQIVHLVAPDELYRTVYLDCQSRHHININGRNIGSTLWSTMGQRGYIK